MLCALITQYGDVDELLIIRENEIQSVNVNEKVCSHQRAHQRRVAKVAVDVTVAKRSVYMPVANDSVYIVAAIYVCVLPGVNGDVISQRGWIHKEFMMCHINMGIC